MTAPQRRSGVTGYLLIVLFANWLIFSGAAMLSVMINHRPWGGLIEAEAYYAVTAGVGLIILMIVPWRKS